MSGLILFDLNQELFLPNIKAKDCKRVRRYVWLSVWLLFVHAESARLISKKELC